AVLLWRQAWIMRPPRAGRKGAGSRFASRARMRGIVDLGEVLEVEVGIDLRGGDVGMPEQFLHAAQIAGRLQYMAGTGVPQQMRMHALPQALLLGQLAKAQLHRAR